MKKILVLALLFSCATHQLSASNIPRFPKSFIAIASTYYYLIEAPARKIKNTFKTIFNPSSVTRYEDNDSCC